ncbi:uncharacterized protein [Haliotis asinina]|uniref:uncharacterized protein n=1 Tax=Haliotis asinina TaxID=109174 RepID=UPI0035321943
MDKARLTMYLHLFICTLVLLAPAVARPFIIEAETVAKERESIFRTQASAMRSSPFHTGDILRVDFCLRKNTSVTLANIRFSNDGDKDIVDVAMDGEYLGSFSSYSNSNFGFNWNKYHYSGHIGKQRTLWPGRHVVTLSFRSTDTYGIEIDSLILIVDDDSLKDDFFRCTAHCDASIKYSAIKSIDDIPSGELVQRSHNTFCAQDRNINYHLFHESITEYRLTATPPRYRTLLNDKKKDSTGCEPVSDIIWEFRNFRVLPSEIPRVVSNARMTFGGDNTAKFTTVNFQFNLDKSFSRQSDVDVASTLILKFQESKTLFSILLGHSSRAGKLTMVRPTSNDGEFYTWEIPEFTWVPDDQNYVNLTIMTPPGVTAVIDNLKLVRKEKIPDKNIVIYEDDETKVVGVVEDQWWRAPRAMTVKMVNSEVTWDKITKISVSRAIRWTEGFNEIFQLYEDGLANINAFVPYGVNHVPFGSSVVIGQFNTTDSRPYAPISTVIVDPYSLKFHLDYVDSSVVDLEINSKGDDTELHVKNANYTRDRSTYPIAAIRSTWVSDGNADIDHVSANLNEPREALNGWESIYGTAFAFFRQCISMHNTQGPDLFLELLGTTQTNTDDTRYWL